MLLLSELILNKFTFGFWLLFCIQKKQRCTLTLIVIILIVIIVNIKLANN